MSDLGKMSVGEVAAHVAEHLRTNGQALLGGGSDVSPPMNWQVYMVLCSDGSLYTGITTDLERRLVQHRQGRGAKYFRGRQAEKVVYTETGHSRSSASRREAAIKALSHGHKLLLVEGQGACIPA